MVKKRKGRPANYVTDYKGKLVVSSVLTEKYNEKTAGKIYKHKWLETVLMSNLNEIYGEEIEVARFRYYPNDRRFDILPLQGNDTPLAKLNENDWSDFIPVQLAPGSIGLAKFKAIQLEDEIAYLEKNVEFYRDFSGLLNVGIRVGNVPEGHNIEISGVDMGRTRRKFPKQKIPRGSSLKTFHLAVLDSVRLMSTRVKCLINSWCHLISMMWPIPTSIPR